MTTDNTYEELPLNQDIQKRKEYWEIGKGLQKADNLKTSQYLENIIQDTLQNKYDTEDAEKRVLAHYSNVTLDSPEHRTKEADLAATRITICLEKGDFKFSPITLKAIHKALFRDILPYEWVGEYRNVNLSRKEDVLNGHTMTYGDYSSIAEYLQYDFEQEKNTQYHTPFTAVDVEKIAKFTSAIWQTHPFREGNTRTVSTFIIKYLRTMGIIVNNTPFQENAKWFRDALVCSNYTNIQKGIHPDISHLNNFFENVILGATHDLRTPLKLL